MLKIMKQVSIFFFCVFIFNYLPGMEQEKLTAHRMAQHIKHYNCTVYTQKNGKQVYMASLVVNGKERVMKARFFTKRQNYQLDESFGFYGVQAGPLV